MTRASWRRVESLFHAAAPHRGAARRRILDARCADEPDLRHAVEALLDTLEASTTFDDKAAGRLAARMATGTTSGPTVDERSDTRDEELSEIGPYRLLRVLGEGGMGTVYLAEQGGPLARRVAIKIPRGGATVSDDATHRFDLERKALARMSHPAIAQVFDAGTTETGRPFVVLEYVDGEPLTTYCDDRRLDLRRRVELFASICDGVAHAHAKAIIHCDLKPSNLLVADGDDGPRAKIIDFGIAKALEPWSDSTALLSHAARGRAGSLRYMSPEALCFGSDVVETRSDVYSLGIVLCELLAGVRPEPAVPAGPPSRPFALPEASGPTRPSELFGQLDATCRLELARGRGLLPRALDRHLRSDLDWIVARATAIDAEERYGSVRELGDDLRRWLTDRPLEARPPSRLYRAGKFLRRHTALTAVVALLACAVIGFGVGSTWLYGRAEVARQQAEGLVTYMLDDLSRHLEPIGRLALLDSVSRRSLAYFEARGGSDAGAVGPAVALRRIASVMASRGDLDAAIDVAERALVLDQARHRRAPDDRTITLDMIDAWRLLGDLLSEAKELDQATRCYTEAETWLHRITIDSEASSRAELAWVETLVGLGSTSRVAGDVETAERQLAEAKRRITEQLREQPDDPAVRAVFGEVHYATGFLAFYNAGDATAAARDFSAGVAAYRRLVRDRPEAVAWRFRLAVLLGQGLASAQQHAGRLDEAWAANGEALDILEILASGDPENQRYVHGLGWEWLRRGDLAEDRQDLDRAAQAYERSAAVQHDLIARSDVTTSAWLDGLATAYRALASLQAQRGDLTAALDAAERALDARRRIAGPNAEHRFYSIQRAVVEVLAGELRHRAGDLGSARRAVASATETLDRLDAETLDEPMLQVLYVDATERLGKLRQAIESTPSRSAASTR